MASLPTPKVLCKNGSEHSHQVAFFAWVAVARNRGFEVADMWAESDDLPKVELDELFPAGFKGIVELEWIHAIPNGGSRGDTDKTRKIEGGRMKAEGVRGGVADMFLPVPRHSCNGLYIEMKAPALKSEKNPLAGLSDDQKAFKKFVQANGFGFAVCYSWREAADVVTQYLS